MEDLEKHVKELKKEIEVLKSKMTELEEFATQANYNEELAEEYYSVLRLMNEKRNELNVLLNNQPREAKLEVKKTFVNSFGEATKREITCSTYERQQKKQQKEIEKFIR